MAVTVGIDLGTTNSGVAWVDDSARPVILSNREGALVTPSVICFLPDRIVIGDEAKELQAAGVGEVAAFFKRQMGDANFLFHANGRDWSAVDLSALLLEQIKQDAERALGKTVTDAVITVPAYFRNPQREATRAAGEQAGLNVLQLINEPTAAAIAYGQRQRNQAGKTLLVYDLGGGTFDLTLLRIDQEEIRILNSEGDHELGGKDWDDRIVEFLATCFEEEYGVNPIADALGLTELLARAEHAKRRLSATASTRIAITHAGDRGTYELNRAKFEEITADLLERTGSLIQKVLTDAVVAPADLDGVLLVGGSTRMPMVHDFITRIVGRPPMTGINVDEAVALGAAVVAAEQGRQRASAGSKFFLGGVRTVDVTNHSLGMIALNEDQSAYLNSIILPKNEPVPCLQTRPYRFRTRAGTGNRLEIFMTQGENENPADATFLGCYVVDSVPHQGRSAAVIDISYAYDASATVAVTAKLRQNGQELPVRVEPLPSDVPTRFLQPPPPQPEPSHVTVYLCFDLSGSMAGQPLAESQKAAERFLQQIDLSHASVGIMAVADRVKTVLKASQNAKRLREAIHSLNVGMVGIGNSVHPFDQVLQLLRPVEGPCYAIVLADGIWYDQATAVEKARRCHEAAIEIVAIGFGSADRSFLQAIASSDEASIFIDLGGLVETFSTIAQVLTEQAGALAPNQTERKLTWWRKR